MGTYCEHCGEKIVKSAQDDFTDWRHQKTGSVFCAKIRGKRPTPMAEPQKAVK